MQTDTNRFFFTFISNLYRKRQVFFNKELEAYNISSAELPYILGLLFRKNGMLQDELSKITKINKAATSRALKSLEQKGYVICKVCEENARHRRIFYTEKALELKEPLSEAIDKWQTMVFQDISEKDKETTIRSLVKMANAVNDV